MKINERALVHFSTNSRKPEKEGWLWKKGELNTSYQKRWCILRGNLLFYFEKRYDTDPVGVIVLELCTVQLAEGGDSSYTFSVRFMGHGMRVYKFVADDEKLCNEWVKCLSLSSYRYLKILVEDLENKARSYGEDALLDEYDGNAIATNPRRKTVRARNERQSRRRRKNRKANGIQDYDHLTANNMTELMRKKKLFNTWTNRSSSPKRMTNLQTKRAFANKGSEGRTSLVTNSSLRIMQNCDRSFSVLHEMFRRSIEDEMFDGASRIDLNRNAI